MNQRVIYIFLMAFFCIETLLAEGVKELSPTSEDRVFLYLNDPRYNNFGQYDGEESQRLYLHIANPNQEQVFLGFSQPVSSAHAPCNNAVPITAFFRIKDPSGRVVYPVKDSPNGQILNPTTTNITSYNQAITGPKPISGQNGYTPFTFDPAGLPAGDYYIEFSTIIDQATNDSKVPIEWFDITVANKAINPTSINGRLFAKNWSLFSPSISCGTNPDFTWFDRAFNGHFFVYTEQNLVVNIDFQGAGFQPGAFNVVFNDVGTNRTGNVIEDRKSINGARSSNSQYNIFLNDPDITVYPTGTLGEFRFQPTFLVCENGSSCVELTTTEPGQIDVLIELDTTSGQLIYDPGTADVLLAFKVEPVPGEQAPYTRCVPWDGRNGFGQNVADINSIKNVALLSRYTQGVYHFPIYDAEYMLNGFDVTSIRPIPNNGSPNRVYYDDVNIPDDYVEGLTQPKEDAFNGCGTPCHAWTNKDFGDLNTINTWFFAREEYKLRVELKDCPFDARADTAVANKNKSILIDVLENDLGTANVDTENIRIGNSIFNGSAFFDNQQLSYTPNSGFVGQDTFYYISCYKTLPISNLCDSTRVVVNVVDSPSVFISTLVNSPTNITPIPLTIVFSETITGFEAGDIVVSNGTISNFSGSNTQYTAEIIPNQDGEIAINIPSNVAQGLTNNKNRASNNLAIVYDKTRPTVDITTTANNPTPFSPIPITITFSESVIGFSQPDILIENATINTFTQDNTGTVYNIEVTPVTKGNIRLNINANIAEDSATNLNIAATPFNIVYNPLVLVSMKALLQTPYKFNTQLMSDDLRVAGLIPLSEPYSTIPSFTHAGDGGGETILNSTTILNKTGPDAIVDWVFIELRAANNQQLVTSTRSALIQRDGDIVDVNGASDLAIGGEAGDYFVAIRHRNHLSVMTANPVSLNKVNSIFIDFTTMAENNLYGNHAQLDLDPSPNGHKWVLWGGNTNNDNKIIAQGGENDSNPIFFEIITYPKNVNYSANYIVNNIYSISDTNMDGRIIFQGTNNDLSIPLINIFQHPNSMSRISFIILEQLP